MLVTLLIDINVNKESCFLSDTLARLSLLLVARRLTSLRKSELWGSIWCLMPTFDRNLHFDVE